ncbi:MAG: TonB-dependent receptor [Acidobacteriaceae bacterium]|nr:TonB-dependent receptor [Acidobacteriaceae bacterium]
MKSLLQFVLFATLFFVSVDAIAQPQEVQTPPAPIRVQTEVNVVADTDSMATTPTSAHGTLSARQLADLPISNRATGLTEILTRTTPGVAADANGFAHPLGEHADTSLSLDGQPITDQQAKVFSNQIDPAIIESLTATTGAPAAEFGDKTSLTVEITTKSGRARKPFGLLSSDIGSFRTWGEALSLGAGTRNWGEFLSINAGGTRRFLDTPEFEPLHARGNSASLFNRIDFQPHARDLLHLNLGAGRSWFQTPDSYDTEAAGQDQRSQIRNLNLALGWNHTFSPDLLLTFIPFVRHDRAQYFPSANPLRDDTATLSQDRTLTNTGFRLDTLYVHGPNTAKVGGTYWHTLLHERFSVALTDPLYNTPCVSGGVPVPAPGIRNADDCATVNLQANPDFLPSLLPYDLTRGGSLYRFDQSADITEAAFYIQDELKLNRLLISAGLRYDIYNGLSRGRQVSPRLGIGYKAPFTRTLLRGSFAHLYETPYNENLIFANESGTATNGSTNPFATFRSEPVRPGTRNQFNIGFNQSFGQYLTLDADYYWKFTHTAYDFDTLFNTPITFSVAWRKSKIDGLALRVALVDLHGLNVSTVMGHVRSRFFTPEVGGLIFNAVPASPVFRIDHGEEFEQTTNLHYDLPRNLIPTHRPHHVWFAATWRYNSGLALPGTTPTFQSALALTPDQQSQIGLHCGASYATPTQAIRNCSAREFGTDRIRIPAPGTFDDDRNPVRVSARTLLDFSAGDDTLYRFEHATLGLRATVINATDKVALYNFLSTFSGTHFVAPRTVQLTLQLAF